MHLRRKLYSRGSSYETTIPKPILFEADLDKKQDIVFFYDPAKKRWYIQLEQRKEARRR